MTANISPYLANNFLNLLNGTAFTAPTGTYLQMHTGDPGAAGTASVSTGLSGRKTITHAASSGGSIVISGTAPSWTSATAAETISHWSLWDATSAGNFLWSGALTTPKTLAVGDNYAQNSHTLSLSPVAA